jgi:hypothetical protein
VLQLMTQLIMINPERLREKTEEQRDTDQTNWVRQNAGAANYVRSGLNADFPPAHRALRMGST